LDFKSGIMPSLETKIASGTDMIDAEPETAPELTGVQSTTLEDQAIKELDDAEVENRRRQERQSGLKPLFALVRSGEFGNEELMRYIEPWAERSAGEPENLAGVLNYFQAAEKIFDKQFPPEQKSEIACALAELISDGYLDAETLQALSERVTYGGKSGTFDKVAEYNPERLGIIIYDELFRDIDGQPQNITHILKHEIAHGLLRHGEVAADEKIVAKIKEMVADAGNLRARETYRSTNAIDRYLAVKNRQGATPDELERASRWLSDELLAEKIAAYLESNGEFGSFIEAQLKVMPPGNIKSLYQSDENETQNLWLAENRTIFDQISEKMKNREGTKEKILASTAEAREEISGYFDDEEFDWNEFLGGGFGEPAIPDNNKSPRGQSGGQGNQWIASLTKLADAFGSEVEQTLPTSELEKAR